ncbi:MAG TPA: aminotransferase class V-fold PLP-dependent enzyme [Candidatus Baltobacteraceae bacterium]
MTTPLPRSEFAVTETYAYLNHAAVGVLPQTTKRAIDAFVDAQARAGVLGTFGYEARMDAYRARVGAFIGAGGDEIAMLRNTGDGATAIANGIAWKDGDEMLLCADEFPSNAIPWLALARHGVNVRVLSTQSERLTPDALRRAISPRTRAVSVSWVNFADGYRHDLAGLSEVTHGVHGIFAVDAIQGLGAFPLDVRALGIDALYASGAKWLLALQGVGFLYVAAELLGQLRVENPGWRSVEDMWDFLNYDQPWIDNASRFEGGTPNFVGALSLATSIDVIDGAGTAAIGKHVLMLTDHLCEGLNRLGASVASIRGDGCSSGIVTFEIPGFDSVALGRAMQHDDQVVTTWRPNGIRVAPHGYNDLEDIDRLLEALGRVVKKGT